MKADFLNHVGQTSPFPIQLEIDSATGIYLNTTDGKQYVDFTSGIAVSNLGHQHPKIIQAIQKQATRHLHTMVYGEFIESPQVEYAKLLTSQLPKQLNCLYYCTSGSEAVEASMKLAKRKTGRREIVSFSGAYHGSTHGALSIMGSEQYKTAFRPLLPDTKLLRYNSVEDLQQITEQTAGVIVEPVQAASGVTVGDRTWLKKLRERCNDVGALLIYDEIQTGFGRTGNLFSFQHTPIVPDVLLLAKAMGGGIPMGGLVSSRKNLNLFTKNPILGHINTFGGNSIACAAAKATLDVLLEETHLIHSVKEKAEFIVNELEHIPAVEQISYQGLLMALHFSNKERAIQFMQLALDKQIVLIGFLLNENAVRLAPPLTITTHELENCIKKLKECLEEVNSHC